MINCRTIWISDVHLGTAASRAGDLLNFLCQVAADRIYLVGDIIDIESMQSRVCFPDSHRQVVSRLLQLAADGAEVIYVPGNHDFPLRDLAGHEVFGIPIVLEAIHHTQDGKRLLVTHGDVLDRQIRSGTNLEQFGAAAYRLLMKLDVAINQLRNRIGQDYVSVSANIKRRLAAANQYIEIFEDVAASYAAERGFDGIVCGHIHRPAIRDIGGVCYVNDGDWVEHRTAVAETAAGSLKLLHWTGGEIVAEALVHEPSIAA